MRPFMLAVLDHPGLMENMATLSKDRDNIVLPKTQGDVLPENTCPWVPVEHVTNYNSKNFRGNDP